MNYLQDSILEKEHDKPKITKVIHQEMKQDSSSSSVIKSSVDSQTINNRIHWGFQMVYLQTLSVQSRELVCLFERSDRTKVYTKNVILDC
jgi:hypothetical protein